MISEIKRRRADIGFIGLFIIAKAAIYLSPFAIAFLAPPEIYAGIELSLAIGLLAASLLVGAPLLGTNQEFLIRGRSNLETMPWLIGIIAIAGVLGTFLLLAAVEAEPILLLAVALVGSSILQNVLSGSFRMRGRRTATSWSDGFAVLSVAAATAIVLFGPQDATLRNLAWVQMALVALVAFCLALTYVKKRVRAPVRSFTSVSRTGLPMMLLGMFAIWVGTGGRIQIGAVSQVDLVLYALAFRVSGIAQGIRQFATTAFFVQIYRAERDEADRWNSYFLVAIIGLLAGLNILVPVATTHVTFAALTGIDNERFAFVLTATSIHTLFWIGYAMLQSRANRYEVTGSLLLPTMGVTFVGIAVFVAIATFLTGDVVALSAIVTLHAVAYFAVNAHILRRYGEPHPRIGVACIAGAAFLLLCLPVSLAALETFHG